MHKSEHLQNDFQLCQTYAKMINIQKQKET